MSAAIVSGEWPGATGLPKVTIAAMLVVRMTSTFEPMSIPLAATFVALTIRLACERMSDAAMCASGLSTTSTFLHSRMDTCSGIGRGVEAGSISVSLATVAACSESEHRRVTGRIRDLSSDLYA